MTTHKEQPIKQLIQRTLAYKIFRLRGQRDIWSGNELAILKEYLWETYPKQYDEEISRLLNNIVETDGKRKHYCLLQEANIRQILRITKEVNRNGQ